MRIWFIPLIVIVSIFILAGCRDGLTEHNIHLDGAAHGKKLYKGANNCTACHGIHLNGNGPIIGCYSCHNSLWSADDHLEMRGGISHRFDMFTSRQSCAPCHGGSTLKGQRSRPSCYQCHEDNWTALETHIINPRGSDRLHAVGLDEPLTNCANCHGEGLRGTGNAPSCYKCHFNIWDTPLDHTSNEHGFNHLPSSESSNHVALCGDCHGKDLKGSFAKSCYGSDCHSIGGGFND